MFNSNLVFNFLLLLTVVGYAIYIAIDKDSQTDRNFKMFVLVNLMIFYIAKINHEQKMKKLDLTTTHLVTASI